MSRSRECAVTIFALAAATGAFLLLTLLCEPSLSSELVSDVQRAEIAAIMDVPVLEVSRAYAEAGLHLRAILAEAA